MPSLLAQAQYLAIQHYECRKTVPSGVDNNRIIVVSNKIFRSCRLAVTRRVPLTELEKTACPTGVSEFTLSCSGIAVFNHWYSVQCFVNPCLSFCLFYFGRCIVCPSICGFWLPVWYLQTVLVTYPVYTW